MQAGTQHFQCCYWGSAFQRRSKTRKSQHVSRENVDLPPPGAQNLKPGASASHRPPDLAGVFIFQGDPKVAQDVLKIAFFSVRFSTKNSTSIQELQNRGFARPRASPGAPGISFWADFWCFLGPRPSCVFVCLGHLFLKRFFVDFCCSAVVASIFRFLKNRPPDLYFAYDSAYPHFAVTLHLPDFCTTVGSEFPSVFYYFF